MTDGTGTTSYAYVPAGQNGALQLSSETGPAGTPAEYSYGYDALGRIDQLTVAGTSQDAVTYDAINRDVTDVTPLGTFDTAYLGETNQVSTVTALGQSISGSSGLTSYGYLPNTGDRRLNTITFNAAAASNETLTSDDADRVDCRTNASGGSAVAETYSYDLADRLTLGTVATTGSACGGTTASTESYGLNNADFISSKSGESTASNNWAATNPGSVNDIGTLTPSGGTGRTYSYDADGNVTSDGVRNYTWDAENRLLSITEIASGHVSTFTYDGLGRRTAITESGGSTVGYLWCGTTLCSSYASGSTLNRFLPWGEVDSGTGYYYERDHLGTVVSTTNSSGTTEATLGTDGYGLTLSSSGTAPNFGYAGMFLHQASGLYLTQYRAYDPYSGRWLSRDPAGEDGGINLYAYVAGDPLNFVDIDGLSTTYYGQATYYNLPGSSTASGVPFDPNALAGAMTAEKVPIGSNVTVNYTSPNGTTSSCRVDINDRGPFARNPDGAPIHPLQPDPKDIIDLTPRAFKQLTGSTTLGRVNVTVTVPGN